MVQKNKNPIRVVQINRRHSKYGSIEILFGTIRKYIYKPIDVVVFMPRYKSQGFFKRVAIIIETFFNQGDINHITGDIHFASFLLKRKKTILTVHDCVSVVHSKGLKRVILKLFWFTLPLKKVKYITVISEKTKNELLSLVNFPKTNIFVIPDCISNQFYYVEQERFNKEKPRILQIGTKINKNLIRVVEALTNIPCILDIVGKLSEQQVEALTSSGIEYENSVNITEEELIKRYINADIVSFISTYEGFGMPILEAQTVGRVIITSNISPMTEVAGKGAYYVNPFDIDDIKKGFLEIINNELYRENIIKEGVSNAEKYNPQTIADMYRNLYLKVFNESKGCSK